MLLSKKYIKRIYAAFIYRYPFETYNDYIDTVCIIKYLKSKGISTQINPLSPVKNSPLYLQYKKKLRLPAKEPIGNINITLGKQLPRECIKLIESNPEIFCSYYYYDSKIPF